MVALPRGDVAMKIAKPLDRKYRLCDTADNARAIEIVNFSTSLIKMVRAS